jgi:hypothetical protein
VDSNEAENQSGLDAQNWQLGAENAKEAENQSDSDGQNSQ